MQSSVFIVNQLTFQNYMFLIQNRSLNLKHVNIPFFAKILINGEKIHRGKKHQNQNLKLESVQLAKNFCIPLKHLLLCIL